MVPANRPWPVVQGLTGTIDHCEKELQDLPGRWVTVELSKNYFGTVKWYNQAAFRSRKGAGYLFPEEQNKESCREKTVLMHMYTLWFKVYFLSYSTRSIRYYVKHNDSYRPFIFLVVLRNAPTSVNAERQPYPVEEKAFFSVCCYCQCSLKCCDLLIVAFHIGQAVALHALCWCLFQLDYT